MKIEGASRDPVELLQSALGITPEALNAIDVMRARDELIVTVIDSIMLTVSDIHQHVVAAPTVGVDNRFEARSGREGSDSTNSHNY